MKILGQDKYDEEQLGIIAESIIHEGYTNDFFTTAIYDMEDSDEYHDVETLLSEFDSDREHGVQRKQWRTIPVDQYRNALKKFMSEGELFRFPENTLREWLYIMIGNTMDLENITAMSGHTQWFPQSEIEEHYGIEDEIGDFNDGGYEYLEKLGFYDWALLPDGTDAISDYGLSPLYKIFQSLPAEPSASEMIVAINRALDVVHCRGDLSSMFIKGGSKTLTQISNESARLKRAGRKLLK